MRSTGGADVAYGMDAAPADSTIVAQLRAKGAIILAKANLSEYNGASGDPGGTAKADAVVLGAGNSRSTWAGNPCNPYDTERAPAQAASSSGSGVSVAANLVTCSICEETGGSCRVPAAYNGLANLKPVKRSFRSAAVSAPTPLSIEPGFSAARSKTPRLCSTP